MRVTRNSPSRPRGNQRFLRSLLVLVVLVGASLCLAFVWQSASDDSELVPADGETVQGSMDDSEEVDQSEPQGTVEAAARQEDSQAPETSEDEQSEETGDSEAEPGEDSEDGETAADIGSEAYAVSTVAWAVPPSLKADNAYFDDAIFIGDSISTGIPLYQVAGSPDTVAVKGLSTQNILTDNVVTAPSGASKTVLDAALEYGEKQKVYIMLGSNALWMDSDTFIEGYKAFLDAVKRQYPDAVIYVQSIPPVTTQAYLTYSTADNDVIREFNAAIAEMSRAEGVSFVDVYQALVDENGVLPLEASPNDGMHLTPEYYVKWFDYLKTHVVEVEKDA